MILSTNNSRPQLLICTQKRYAPNPLCCANSGSESLLIELKKAAAENSVNIDILETKSMLPCKEGPNVRLNPIGKFWNRVSIHTIPDITGIQHKTRC